MRVRLGVAALLVLMAAGSLPAQPLFTSAFTAEEFAERRARVFGSWTKSIMDKVLSGAASCTAGSSR